MPAFTPPMLATLANEAFSDPAWVFEAKLDGQRSLLWSHAHYDEAFAVASQVGCGHAEDHIRMFSNDDTLYLRDDVRAALNVMFERIADLGLGPRLEAYEIIEPSPVLRRKLAH